MRRSSIGGHSCRCNEECIRLSSMMTTLQRTRRRAEDTPPRIRESNAKSNLRPGVNQRRCFFLSFSAAFFTHQFTHQGPDAIFSGCLPSSALPRTFHPISSKSKLGLLCPWTSIGLVIFSRSHADGHECGWDGRSYPSAKDTAATRSARRRSRQEVGCCRSFQEQGTYTRTCREYSLADPRVSPHG